jgi:hypothetical protein
VSYDLSFVRKTPDESWADALAADEDDDQTAEPDERAWAQIVKGVPEIVPALAAGIGGEGFALDDEHSGIQLSLEARTAEITVPYWYRGPEALKIVRTIYALGTLIEEATGLFGYDFQLDLPLAEAAARPDLGAAYFDQVAASFERRGVSSPSNLGSASR